MRVLVLGAGATGGWFGARLIEAGADVDFLVRPARAAALAANGLRIESASRPFAAPVRALGAVPADARYDLVLLSCKAYDLATAIDAIRPAVGAHTRVLPLLNGLRHLDALDAAFGAPRVLGGLCHISVTLTADGAIRQFGALERLTWGARRADDPALPALRATLQRLPGDVREPADILAAMWEKFAFIAALGGITCLLRAPVGVIAASGEGAALARRLYAECAEVAAREGRPIDAAARAEAERILTAPGSPLKASMLRDLERGGRTEGEHILGDLRARAHRAGLDTPLLAAAHAHVAAYERQRAVD
ncbi:MAG: ketopantoate reductase family protein [Mizugakiibacter sp.]|uniref:ketopantoate reductase family protein n=1 Tax=Mizugakiibacter sp. TaxID=1972610 RepID=UPI0031BF75F0|nr:ketopantoate reductase family protein [Xanthomonadaceae bacterium]